MKAFFCTLFLFVFYQISFSTCTTNGTGGGTWGNASTWVCSPESSPPTNPSCPDSIIILATDSVYISDLIDLISCGPVHIVLEGAIEFKTGKKLKLASGSSVDIKAGGVMHPGGGGGSSNYLEIGGNQVWTAADGDAYGPRYYTEGGILPIKLLSFEANVNNDKIDLKWVTVSEVNNDFFTIEKSTDAKVWEVVSIINGAGNSNMIIEYFDTDYSPYDGASYYRLKQTDYDGKYSYSNIVPVKYIQDNENAGIMLFPNPVNKGSSVKLTFDDVYEEKILVVLRDVKGAEYFSKIILNVEDGIIEALPIDYSIPSGLYLVTATSENQIYSQKVLVK